MRKSSFCESGVLGVAEDGLGMAENLLPAPKAEAQGQSGCVCDGYPGAGTRSPHKPSDS